VSEDFDPALPGTLKVISAAMGLGIALLSGIVVFTYVTNARPATPEALRTVNVFTAITMGVALAAIILSEILWHALLKRAAAGAFAQKLAGAFIARMACREGAALLGCVTALLAAMSGVLRAYPAYWANLAPAVLFWSYLYLHWPTAENLKTEISEVLSAR